MASKERRLRNARRNKQAIAQSLKQLKDGTVRLEQILDDRNGVMGRVRIWTILTHTPKIGEVGAKKILVSARVWPEDRLSTLDAKKVGRIIEALPPRAKES